MDGNLANDKDPNVREISPSKFRENSSKSQKICDTKQKSGKMEEKNVLSEPGSDLLTGVTLIGVLRLVV